MIKLSKKEAFTLVETMVFVLTLSFILAASVPLIARKHKHTPKVVSHGTYVCYRDSAGNYVKDTYNSRYLVDREVNRTPCRFETSDNVPIYNVTLIPPGGGGVNYYTNTTVQYNDSDFRGTRQESRDRFFNLTGRNGQRGYKTGSISTNDENWNSRNALDDGLTATDMKLALRDLRDAFRGVIYSVCVPRQKSGDSGDLYYYAADTSQDMDVQEELLADVDEFESCKNWCTGLGVAGACLLGGVIGCGASATLLPRACKKNCATKEEQQNEYGVSPWNYPINKTKVRTVAGAGGVYNSGSSNALCVQTSLDDNKNNGYYARSGNRGKTYEGYLRSVIGTIKDKPNGDGSDGADYPKEERDAKNYYEVIGKCAGDGGSITPSTITNWDRTVYTAPSATGGTGACIKADGGNTSSSAGSRSGGTTQTVPSGVTKLNTARTPKGLIQTVTATVNYVNVGKMGRVGTPLSFETFAMRGTCDIFVNPILEPQLRRETWQGTQRTNANGNNIGASITCRDRNTNRIVMQNSVQLPEFWTGNNQFERKERGSWDDSDNRISDITKDRHEYVANTEYDDEGVTNGQSVTQGYIDQLKNTNNVWSKKDSRGRSKTPFEDFGKGGAGQTIVETCHPIITSSWVGQNTTSANSGSRQIHGFTRPCNSRNTISIGRQAQPGESGAVIISW